MKTIVMILACLAMAGCATLPPGAICHYDTDSGMNVVVLNNGMVIFSEGKSHDAMPINMVSASMLVDIAEKCKK